MSTDPRSIIQVFSDHWPQEVFARPTLREAAEPIALSLRDQYKHASPETINAAAQNTSDFAHRLEQQVDGLHESQLISDEQMRRALSSPAFTRSLLRAFIDSSETASEFSHEQLARLVAMQLTTDGESFQSIALRMAAERTKYLTDRQLRELGLMFAMMYMEWTEDEAEATGEQKFAQYAKDCDDMLRPFEGVEPLFLDLQHMEGLSLLRLATFATQMFAMSSSSQETHSPLLAPLSLRLYGLLKPLGPLDAPPIIGRMHALMEGAKSEGSVALRGVKLFPPGFLIGYTVYSNLHRTPMVLTGFE